TIEYLTFDGNRWAFGAPPSSGFSTAPNLSCLQGNFCGNDLDLTQAVIATVWYVNFIRAPDSALGLGGSGDTPTVSTVDYSTFGFTPSTGVSGECTYTNPVTNATTPTACATRTTSITLMGYSGAYYNTVQYSGTAAITMENTGTPVVDVYEMAYGNTLTQNRYELSDGNPTGGQLYVD